MVRFWVRFILFSVVFASSFAASNLLAAQGPQSFTLDGRLKQAGSNNPLSDPSVTIEVYILDPAKECILYAEQQIINTSASNGYFNIQVGSDTVAAKRIAGSDPGLVMSQVFENTTTKTAISYPGQVCAGGTYAPTAQDARHMRLVVTPSATGVAETLSPDTILDSVPMAVVAERAESIQGFQASDLLQVNTGGGVNLSQANLQSVFTGAAWTNIQAVMNGEYVSATNSTGVNLPTYSTASAPGAVAAGSMWYDSDTNQVKYYDGASTVAVGNAASGITSLTASSPLAANGVAGGTLTGPGTISLANSGVGAGTYTKVTVTAKGIVTGGSSLIESDIPALTGSSNVSGDAITSGTIGGSTNLSTTGTVSAAGISTNQILIYDDDNSNYARLVVPSSGALAADYTLTLPTNDGGTGQVLSTDGSGNLSWITSLTGVVGEGLTSGQIWVGDASNQAANVAMSGDATLNSSGVLNLTTDSVETINITDNNVTLGKIEQIQTTSLLGRYSPLAGDVENITLDMGDFSLDASGQLTVDFPVASVTASSPLVSSGGANPNISIAQANSSTDGYLAQADWTTFNNKLSNSLASGNLFVGNASGSVSSMGIGTGLSIDGSGNLVATGTGGTVTNVSGSGIISVINNTTTPVVSLTGVVPVSNGGTNSSAALNNNRIMVSSGGAIVESSALNDGQVLIGQSGGAPQVANLSAGAGVNISNGSGSITISATGSGGTVTNVSGSGPISVASNATTPIISIAQASGSQDGYLAQADWNTFNNKLNNALASGNLFAGNASGTVSSIGLDATLEINASGNLALAAGAGADNLGNHTATQNISMNGFRITNDGGATDGILIANDGKVAIGSGAVPANMALQVYGSIQVGDGGETCGAGEEGGIRYNGGNLQYCAGGGWLTLGTAGAGISALTGDVEASGSGSVTATIASGAVTYAKMQNVSQDDVLLGRVSGAGGVVEEVGLGAGLTIDGSGNLAAVNNGTVTSVSGSGPISSSGGTDPEISIAQSASGIDGYLSGTDWSTFNSKLSTSLASGNLLVGNALGDAASVAMSGDATMDNAGAITIANGAIDSAKIANGAVDTIDLANDAVDFTKLQNLSASGVLVGRFTAGAGDAEEITLGTGLALDASGVLSAAGSGGTVTSVNGSGPISSSGGTDPEISIAQSSGSQDGYLAQADWTTFNNKLATTLASGNIFIGDGAGNAVQGSITAGTGIVVSTASGSITISSNVTNTDTGWDHSASQNIVMNGHRIINASGSVGGILIANDGKVAVGSGAVPANMALQVYGSIQVGDGGETCGAGEEGGIRYNGGNLQYCAGGGWLTLGTAGAGLTALTGDVLASGSGSQPAQIASGAVTYAKMQNVSQDDVLLGRVSGAGGVVEEVGLGAGLTIDGSGNLAAINNGTVTSVSGSGPISSSGGTDPEISIAQAASGVDGYLSGTDWSTFNSKLSTSIASGNLLVGNASGDAASVAMSGDATMDNAGAITIATGAIDSAKIANGAVDTVDLANDAVDFTKLQNLSASGVLVGRFTAGAGDAEEITLGTGLALNASGVLSAAGSGGTVTSVSGSGPISSSGGTDPEISIAQASGSQDGYLAQADWNTFNNKLATSLASGNIFIGDGTGNAVQGSITAGTGIVVFNGLW